MVNQIIPVLTITSLTECPTNTPISSLPAGNHRSLLGSQKIFHRLITEDLLSGRPRERLSCSERAVDWLSSQDHLSLQRSLNNSGARE